MTSTFLECWGERVGQKEQFVVLSYVLHLHIFPAYLFPGIVRASIVNPQAHSHHESTASDSNPLASEASFALFQIEIMVWRVKSLCLTQVLNYRLMFLGSRRLTYALECSDWRGLLLWDLIANGLAPIGLCNPEPLEATAGVSASYCH